MVDIVVIFDFDKTIIDCDSDNWVLDELGATKLFNQLLPTMPWNPLMVSLFFFYFAFSCSSFSFLSRSKVSIIMAIFLTGSNDERTSFTRNKN